jgi:hypothetical protein
LALALGPWAAGCGGGGGGGSGGAGGACAGADAPRVGACVYDDGSCTEYHGALDEAEARVDCSDPAFPGTFQAGGCPAATRTSGGCVTPKGNGSAIDFDASIPAGDLQQLCVQFGGCYFGP